MPDVPAARLQTAPCGAGVVSTNAEVSCSSRLYDQLRPWRIGPHAHNTRGTILLYSAGVKLYFSGSMDTTLHGVDLRGDGLRRGSPPGGRLGPFRPRRPLRLRERRGTLQSHAQSTIDTAQRQLRLLPSRARQTPHASMRNRATR